mmetsp:Transcript_63821/g.118617  ORF Transcript_63821/g.118617 Transcript_63821/m.118617 type:complete len:659 (+) Transcript_63821:156-2132(+)
MAPQTAEAAACIVLGLEPGFGSEDVKRAFRRLALEFHPDKNKAMDAEKAKLKFQAIVKAKDILLKKLGDNTATVYRDDSARPKTGGNDTTPTKPPTASWSAAGFAPRTGAKAGARRPDGTASAPTGRFSRPSFCSAYGRREPEEARSTVAWVCSACELEHVATSQSATKGKPCATVIRSTSCFCGHPLSEHAPGVTSGGSKQSKLRCWSKGCLCGEFSFVPPGVECTCGHRSTEHESMPHHACEVPGCLCGTFHIAGTCGCGHPWTCHRTEFNFIFHEMDSSRDTRTPSESNLGAESSHSSTSSPSATPRSAGRFRAPNPPSVPTSPPTASSPSVPKSQPAQPSAEPAASRVRQRPASAGVWRPNTVPPTVPPPVRSREAPHRAATESFSTTPSRPSSAPRSRQRSQSVGTASPGMNVASASKEPSMAEAPSVDRPSPPRRSVSELRRSSRPPSAGPAGASCRRRSSSHASGARPPRPPLYPSRVQSDQWTSGHTEASNPLGDRHASKKPVSRTRTYPSAEMPGPASASGAGDEPVYTRPTSATMADSTRQAASSGDPWWQRLHRQSIGQVGPRSWLRPGGRWFSMPSYLNEKKVRPSSAGLSGRHAYPSNASGRTSGMWKATGCPPETRADDSEFIYEDKESLDQQIGVDSDDETGV